MADKLFIGPRVRRLREARGWTLDACAARLGLSISYLSQIETNQRPVTARVLISLMRVFEVDAATFDADDEDRLGGAGGGGGGGRAAVGGRDHAGGAPPPAPPPPVPAPAPRLAPAGRTTEGDRGGR